ncbi:type 1 glutamine amidotransferase [Hydrogenothermus marinus]|uniref:type 1 glutamine amidotransferase n=1 Tax=Hydrogenothermus marinus TaxID=133270 RepID=UPI001B86380D|nr:type 1 glutamine amidotransferase [Hydrogenothermus marinus]
MRIHYFQHVPFETPANIENWAKEKGHLFKGTYLYKNQPFPDFSSFDMLVIMGGPMSVSDENKYPFLKREKIFIENAIKLNKKVVGICLGAQLIAEVLGSKVYKNKEKEIGWYPVYLTDEGKKSNIFKDLLQNLCLSIGMEILLTFQMEL